MKLPRSYYKHTDVVAISRELLGKVLCTRRGNARVTQAIITETEAYAGVGDRASHAYGGRLTPRTAPMFEPGGLAYVYLCYGIHHLFNVVTGPAETPHAVLVRAGLAWRGRELIGRRRGRRIEDDALLQGPGRLSQGMGITTRLSGVALDGAHVWIEDQGIVLDARAISAGPRIGIDYAGEDAKRAYRFVYAGPDPRGA